MELYVNISSINSGHMDNRYLTMALFAQEVDDISDSFIDVAHCLDHGRLLHNLLIRTIKHMEYWRSAFDKVLYDMDVLFTFHKTAITVSRL